MRKLLAGLFALTFAASAAAAPLRLSGRILPPVPADLRIELDPAIPSTADEIRRFTGPAAPPLATARPRPDGSFEIAAPEPGLFRVTLRAAGFVPLVQTEIPLVMLAPGTELPPAALQRDSALDVRVEGPDGHPASGVSLCAVVGSAGEPVPHPSGEGRRWFPAERCGASGADGRLTVPRRSGETLLLSVTDSRYFGQSMTAEPGAATARIRLTATRPEAIEVRGSDGKPVAGVLARAGNRGIAVTGSDGRALFVLPGEGDIELEAADGRWAVATFPPNRQRTAKPRIVSLGPPETVTGRALDSASRAPLAGALIWDSSTGSALTGADGAFRLPSRAGRQTVLQAVAAGHVRSRQLIQNGGSVALLLEPAGEIAGRVLDGAGRPVAGAAVHASPVAWRPGLSMDNPVVKTRADGGFLLYGLPLGTCRLSVSRAGFAPASTVAEAAAPDSRTGVTIVLSAGKTASGRVVDEQGKPIAGAAVSLTSEEQSAAQESYQAVTDAAGAFHLDHLAAGRFRLQAARSGFAPASVPGIEIPDEPGEVSLEEIRMEAGAVIEGRVTDPRGAPVSQALVFAQKGEMPPSGDLPDESPALREPLMTGLDGRFRLNDLPRGVAFDFQVRRDGFAPANLPGVTAPTAEPLRIELRPARRLTGRVLDADGAPLAGATVLPIDTGAGLGEISLSLGGMDGGRGGTDTEGFFTVSDLTPGVSSFVVRASGYRPALLRNVPIPEDRDAGPVEVTLEKGATLTGRVLDGRGAPLAGAMVSVQADANGSFQVGGWEDVFLRIGLPAVTDAEGGYRIEGLVHGGHIASASTSEGRQVSQPVRIGPGENRLDLRLAAGVEVSGRVTGEDGAPVAGAEVLLLSEASGQEGAGAVSHGDGTFVIGSVHRGKALLSASARGFAETLHPEPLQVGDEPVRGIEIRLVRGGTITGRLLGLPEDERNKVKVQALPGEDVEGLDYSGSVDREGRFRISGVPPGAWRVAAERPSGQRAEAAVRLATGGGEAAVDLRFSSGSTLTGRILFDGAPLAGARLFAVQDLAGFSRGEARQATAAHDGTFVLRDLPPGSYQIVAAFLEGFIAAGTAGVDGDREVTLEIFTGTFAGRVLREGGGPLAGATVSLRASGAGPGALTYHRAATTDEQGAFELRVPAGTYEATVRMDGLAKSPATTIQVAPGGTAQAELSWPLTP